MQPTIARSSFGTLIPPKIATPKTLSGGGGASLAPLVDFYGKLPKGANPSTQGFGIKSRYFNGKNASGKPIVVFGMAMLIGAYTLDYQMHLKHHKNHPH